MADRVIGTRCVTPGALGNTKKIENGWQVAAWMRDVLKRESRAGYGEAAGGRQSGRIQVPTLPVRGSHSVKDAAATQ